MRSKLAIASFVLSLIPIIIAFWFMPSGAGTLTGADGAQTTFELAGGPIGIFVGTLFLSSIITFWIGLLAIILGIVALVKIRKYNLGGKWFAIVGIVIGAIPSVIGVVILILNLVS